MYPASSGLIVWHLVDAVDTTTVGMSIPSAAMLCINPRANPASAHEEAPSLFVGMAGSLGPLMGRTVSGVRSIA